MIKKILFPVFVLVFARSLQGQVRYDELRSINDLPVGIYYQSGPGINNTLHWQYPYGIKLTVKGNNARNIELVTSKYPLGQLLFRQWDLANKRWEPYRQLVSEDTLGNVGIGTERPNAHLQVLGGTIRLTNPDSYGFNIDMTIAGDWAWGFSWSHRRSPAFFSLGAYGHGANLRYGYIGGSVNGETIYTAPWMVFLPSGNVGIGTKTPQSKLAVNGTITAQKVKVTQTGWPDYVFDKGYHLPALDSVKAFISQNERLPGIPSASDIQKLGNDLAETDVLLLEKVEELTLYIIDLNERLKQQDQLIQQLHQGNKILRKKNEKVVQQVDQLKQEMYKIRKNVKNK